MTELDMNGLVASISTTYLLMVFPQDAVSASKNCLLVQLWGTTHWVEPLRRHLHLFAPLQLRVAQQMVHPALSQGFHMIMIQLVGSFSGWSSHWILAFSAPCPTLSGAHGRRQRRRRASQLDIVIQWCLAYKDENLWKPSTSPEAFPCTVFVDQCW